MRHLAVVVAAAFELPVTLSVSGIDTNVTGIADATVLETPGSQIAATVSEADVRSLTEFYCGGRGGPATHDATGRLREGGPVGMTPARSREENLSALLQCCTALEPYMRRG